MASTSALLRATGISAKTGNLGEFGKALLRATKQEGAAFSSQRNKRGRKKSQDDATFSSPLEEESTATEHATLSSEPDLAASSNNFRLLPLTPKASFPQPPASTATEHASTSTCHVKLDDKDLEKIAALLVFMAKDFFSTLKAHDIYIAALDVILKHSQADQALDTLNTASRAKLSRLIDIMIAHKDGTPKDPNDTLAFMRRCAQIREEVRPTWGDNATERVELNEKDVALCYKTFGRNLLSNDLRPDQWYDKKYWLRHSGMTTSQRSFVDHLLRKKLGDKKVAVLIWQRGLPSIADRPVSWQRGLPRKQLDMITLKSCLNECLQWYINLANAIVVHRSQEGFRQQLSASSLEELQKQQHRMRRKALKEARRALRRGPTLAEQRDNRKRAYADMNDAEQNHLEEYETGRANQVKRHLSRQKIKAFRSNTQVT